MAAIIKKAAVSKGMSMKDLLGQFQKDYGEDIGTVGGSLVNSARIPTGLFPLDLALGGGFPVNKVSTIYGPESSSKTNIALLAIANFQRQFPELTCVFIDVENSYDPDWAGLLGVNKDKIVVIKPSYGEQVVDMAESALYTPDCGIVVIDSLAAVLTTREMNNSAEIANVGGATLLIGSLCRKTTNALMAAEKAERKSTLIYINQIRSKVGVVMGNPETLPGGNAPKFQSNIVLRVYGKNIMDPKVSKVMPVLKQVQFKVAKWKCPVLCATGMFSMATIAHAGLQVGQCDDFNTVSEYLKSFGDFEKDPKKGWTILGDHYPVIKEFEAKLFGDPVFGQLVRAKIINRMLEGGKMLAEGDEAGEGAEA